MFAPFLLRLLNPGNEPRLEGEAHWLILKIVQIKHYVFPKHFFQISVNI